MTVFIRIVESGGISRAAEQLGVAKSAVSRRLVDLETRLGVLLLNRTTRTSNLTEAGGRFYERAKKIVDDVAELHALTEESRNDLKGTINLAVPVSFGLCHLAGAIDEFLTRHPGLTININFSDHHLDLIEEGIDLAFRIAELKDSSLVARKIAPIKRILCASPAYLDENGIPEKPSDLLNHRLLHYNSLGPSNWKLVDHKGQQHSVHVSAKIIANNGDFLKDMAIAGHGIFITPSFISWRAIASGNLVQILPDYRPPLLNAYAVYPQTRFLSHRTRTLIDFLIERFGDNPYWDQNLAGNNELET